MPDPTPTKCPRCDGTGTVYRESAVSDRYTPHACPRCVPTDPPASRRFERLIYAFVSAAFYLLLVVFSPLAAVGLYQPVVWAWENAFWFQIWAGAAAWDQPHASECSPRGELRRFLFGERNDS